MLMTAAPAPQTSLFTLDVPLPTREQTSLASTAMLWSLHIGRWSGWKYDRAESEALALRHNAGKKRTRVNKSAVPLSELEEISEAIGRARRDHYFLTLPWTDDGWRVLPGATYLEHAAKLQENEAAF
jgi:hypothetical protein